MGWTVHTVRMTPLTRPDSLFPRPADFRLHRWNVILDRYYIKTGGFIVPFVCFVHNVNERTLRVVAHYAIADGDPAFVWEEAIRYARTYLRPISTWNSVRFLFALLYHRPDDCGECETLCYMILWRMTRVNRSMTKVRPANPHLALLNEAYYVYRRSLEK